MKAYKWQAVDLNGARIEGEGHSEEDCVARAGECTEFACMKNEEPETHVHTEDAFPVVVPEPVVAPEPELKPSRVDEILADQAFRLDITTLITAWWVTQKANALGMGDALIRPDFVEFIGLE